MPSNSEVRGVQFAQGVEIVTAGNQVSGSDTLDLANDQAALSTGITADLATVRELVFGYSIIRFTDTTNTAGDVIIERGTLKLTANPNAALVANKWILTREKDDEGISPDVTFSITVASGVVTLKYATTNLAGANHHCYFSYDLTTRLV